MRWRRAAVTALGVIAVAPYADATVGYWLDHWHSVYLWVALFAAILAAGE